MFNGFGGGGSMQGPNQSQQHFQGTMQPQSFNAQGGVMNQPQASGGSSGGAATAPAQPKQRVRARRGQATDPHSIAERVCCCPLFSCYSLLWVPFDSFMCTDKLNSFHGAVTEREDCRENESSARTCSQCQQGENIKIN